MGLCLNMPPPRAHMHTKMDKFAGAPEGVPRLFDLVKPKDDKFRPAFYFALRDTCVASGMIAQRQILRKKSGVMVFGRDSRFARAIHVVGGALEQTSARSSRSKSLAIGYSGDSCLLCPLLCAPAKMRLYLFPWSLRSF